MTYRPIAFEVENVDGIPVEIELNPECIQDSGGNVWFRVNQDADSIVISLGALEMLVDAANELLAGWRGKRAASPTVPAPKEMPNG